MFLRRRDIPRRHDFRRRDERVRELRRYIGPTVGPFLLVFRGVKKLLLLLLLSLLLLPVPSVLPVPPVLPVLPGIVAVLLVNALLHVSLQILYVVHDFVYFSKKSVSSGFSFLLVDISPIPLLISSRVYILFGCLHSFKHFPLGSILLCRYYKIEIIQ